METSITLSPQGHVAVKRFLEGELVEVRQREKGLRGSWHPAVIIGVKPGRRVVEYDELLTDDQLGKLSEAIPVGRGLDGSRGSSRLPWKTPTRRSRALLRPRPPPLPDPASVSWTKGLWVDCFFQDAWWEGVLTETISSASRQKRAVVWFPEEEDHESMLIKDMRVGQDWDEDTGLWSLRGCVDVPVARREKRVRTMSLGEESGGFLRNRRSPRGMELAISLKIDDSTNPEKVTCSTIPWTDVDRKSSDEAPGRLQHSDGNARISAQLKSSTTDATLSSPTHKGVNEKGSEDEEGTTEKSPPSLDGVVKSDYLPSGGVEAHRICTREESASAATPLDMERANLKPAVQNEVELEPESTMTADGGITGCEKSYHPGEQKVDVGEPVDKTTTLVPDSVDEGKLGDENVVHTDGKEEKEELASQARTIDFVPSAGDEEPEPVEDVSIIYGVETTGCDEIDEKAVDVEVGADAGTPSQIVNDGEDGEDADEKSARKLLIESGWNVTRNYRKTGKAQWYYRSPTGQLLGSLQSALVEMKLRSEESDGCEEENPTLNELMQRFASRDRKKNSKRVGTPKNGKKKSVYDTEPIVSHASGQVNGLPGQDSLASIHVAGSDKHGALESGEGIGLSVLSTSSSKRNATVSELAADQKDNNEQKRRRTHGSMAERTESVLELSMQGWTRTLAEDGQAWGVESLRARKAAVTDCAQSYISMIRDDRHGLKDVNFSTLRMKKRGCQAEDFSQDQEARSNCSNSPTADHAADHEPRPKKSRAFTTDVVSVSECRSRKVSVTVQESHTQAETKSRKKGLSPIKATDLKQVKKGASHAKKSALQVKKSKKSRTPARPGVRLEVLLSAPLNARDPSAAEGDSSAFRKRTLLSWLIDNGTVVEHERVRYLNRKDGHLMLEGYVTREGILCDCCKKVVTLSVFESHAGSKLHRPSANIFLDDGRSLSSCQVEALEVKTQTETETQKVFAAQEPDKSDDTCGICGDGGELICCDHCPSTFHLSCMGMQAVPEGDWFCPNCRCAICGGSQFNGDKSTFNDFTVVFCDQCECEYHVKCLRERGIEMKCRPQEDWFCGETCGTIFRGLRGLVGVSKAMEGGFTWTLLRSRAEDDRKSGCISNKELNAEHDSKLSIALSVMQECFRPMIDPRTKIDIITHVLYNRRSEVSRLNFHGFYTMLLERGDELISVATIRVHGARLAEVPLIGTRFQYRRQGMCRRLMGALEEMLKTVGVERLVLPAVPELLETWTGAFGFQPMEGSERLQLMDLNIMAFPGTSILFKPLEKLKSSAIEVPALVLTSPMEEDAPRHEIQPLPTVLRRKRGRPPRARRLNYCPSLGLLSPTSRVTDVHVEQVTRFGDEVSSLIYRPASPTGAVVVESMDSKQPAFTSIKAWADTSTSNGPRKDTSRDSGLCIGTNLPHGGDEEAKKAATLKILKSVLGVGSSQPDRLSALKSTNMEDINALPCERLSDGGSPSIEGDVEELDNAAVIRTTRSRREVKTPGWLLADQTVNEMAKAPTRSLPTRERSCKTRGLERQCQTEIPALESATTCNTKTYERRKNRLSPQSNREPLSRIQPRSLSEGNNTISRAIDFSADDLECASKTVYVPKPVFECEPFSAPLKTFPSQFASREYEMPPGTFIPVQTTVVNTHGRGESSIPDGALTSRSEEKVFIGSCDEGVDRREGPGKFLVRLKIKHPGVLRNEKKMKKKRPKESPETSTAAELPEKFSERALGVGTEEADQDSTSFEQFDQEQRNKSESVMEPHFISVLVK